MTNELIKIGNKYYYANEVQKVLDSRIENEPIVADKNLLLDILANIDSRIQTAIANEIYYEDLQLQKDDILAKLKDD